MIYRLVQISSNNKKASNNYHFGGEGKSVMIIDANNLCKTPSNKAIFIAHKKPVSLALDVIHLIITDQAFARGQRDETPCLIVNKSLKLKIHSFLPLRIIHSNIIRRGFLIMTNIGNIVKM